MLRKDRLTDKQKDAVIFTLLLLFPDNIEPAVREELLRSYSLIFTKMLNVDKDQLKSLCTRIKSLISVYITVNILPSEDRRWLLLTLHKSGVTLSNLGKIFAKFQHKITLDQAFLLVDKPLSYLVE